MTSRERVALALKHEEADRIPYDLGGTTVTSITRNAYQAAMKARGMSTEYDVNEVDPISQIVTPIEENLVALKSDTRRIGSMRIPEYHLRKRVNGKSTRVTDFYGCDWELIEGKDLYFNQKTFPLEKYSSISEGLVHLPRTSLEDFHSILRKDLDRQILQVGEHACVVDRHVAGFTENSVRIRGYENWYMDTVMDPEGVDKLIAIVLEDKINYWDEVIDWAIENGQAERIQVIAECDDLGTQSSTILDPDVLRTLVIPRLKTLFTHVKKRLPHVKVFMHTCGSVRELLPDLIEAGMDILNPVQFTAAHMDLAGLKRDFGKDLTFWGGGVDTQSVLNNGSPEEVSDQVKRIIDILAPGGGFVFAPVHNVQDDVSPDNFWAMWDALQEYGKY
ncbi:MAG: uroporphyrinogen decarboxylase family protein [Bacteroidales bacterium]